MVEISTVKRFWDQVSRLKASVVMGRVQFDSQYL